MLVQLVTGQMVLQQTISGGITPKSIVSNGHGLYFAQNMIYMHHVTVYDDNFNLKKKLSDRVNLNKYGFDKGSAKGGPVEVAFSHDGKYAWVSNYTMEGDSFPNPGCDNCHGPNYDHSYVYRINTSNFDIEKVIEVGSVPKFVACSPNNKLVLVSNWSSGDVSIIDTEKNKTIKSVKVGRHPRGIVIDSKSEHAYITVMGSNKIIDLNLEDFSKTIIENVGRAPRHVVLSPDDRYLYCSINSLGKIVKIDLSTKTIVGEAFTGSAPRSMEITPDGQYLYVVNYHSNSVSKVNTQNMIEEHETSTKVRPIGITLNWDKSEVWVACYSGYIQIFKDTVRSRKDSIDLLASLDYIDLAINSSILSEMKTENKSPLSDSTQLEIKSIIVESESSDVPVENNFISNTYVIVGSFKNQDNVNRLVKRIKGQGFEANALPSTVHGLTYVAIPIIKNPTSELSKVRRIGYKDAWIYRPS